MSLCSKYECYRKLIASYLMPYHICKQQNFNLQQTIFYQIDEAEFESWASRFRVASIALNEREEKLAEAADSIEREMVRLS